jgi:hypothetical protein
MKIALRQVLQVVGAGTLWYAGLRLLLELLS